jgi:ubiquitin-protein ligase
MTNERLQIEIRALEKFFPRKYAFKELPNSEMLLEVGVKTQNDNIYKLDIELPADYPSSLPKVYIVYPAGLKNYHGNNLLSPSTSMHTLHGKNNAPQICHIWANNWGPQRSLMQVVMKARIWLEAFEYHLVTGRSLDVFLSENLNL